MSIMYLLIGCSLLLAIGFLAAFIWSVRSGQLEDQYTPSVRILFDEIDVSKQTPSDQPTANESLTKLNTSNHAN